MGRVKARQSKSEEKEERIRRALEERQKEGTTLRELALKYSVGRSTLSDRIRGGQSMREAMAIYQAMTPTMERALEKWVVDMERIGFPPRLDLFKAVAAQLAKKRAEEEGDPKLAQLGSTWLRGFLDRHPKLSTKFAVKLDRQRSLASQPGPIRIYFRDLERILQKYKFKPHNMYNMDEKGFLLGMGNRAKVIVRRGQKAPTEVQDGSREWITVVETCCADNTMLPPMVIFKGKGIYRGWFDADVKMDPRTAFAHSDKGFTTDELALTWLRDYFDPWTKSRANGEPRLLLLDGHRCHYSLEFVRFATHNNIIPVSYPSHSTHLLQPLDVVLFSPLQQYYGNAVSEHTRLTGTSVTKKLFWSFYLTASKKAYTKENIKASWRKSGIYPFNPDAVLQPLLSKIEKNTRHASSKAASATTPSKFMAWKTPQNRRELRHQTTAGLELIKTGITEATAIALLRRLAHQTESAMTTAEIANIEKEAIKARYAGKKLGKGGSRTRQKLTKLQVADWAMLEKLEKESQDKERLMEEKAKVKAQRAKTKALKDAQKAQKQLSTVPSKGKKAVTIVIADDPAANLEPSEGSGSDEEESEFERAEDRHLPRPVRTMKLRPRSGGKQAYSGYGSEDWDDLEDE